MKKHPARLKAAGIGPKRYAELKSYVAQYEDMRRALRRARAGIVDRPEGGNGAWRRPDPTASEALRLAGHPYARRVRMIEQCARAVASAPVARAILRGECTGETWERLGPPCGRRQFYDTRLEFYIALDGRLWAEEARAGELGHTAGVDGGV